MTLVFGLTGGIASGKSTVSNVFWKQDILVIDADIVSKSVSADRKDILKAIRQEFGDEATISEPGRASGGRINPKVLGPLVFNDKAKRERLNAIMFPAIREVVDRGIEWAERCWFPLVCYDAALLLESGDYERFRPIVAVVAEPSLRVERLGRRNNLSEEDAWKRVRSQEDPVKIADIVIENNGTVEELEAKARDVANTLWDRVRAGV
jgi:dephospho-CoA kinase